MVQPLATYVKDPDATLDYTVEWTPWLSAVSDAITSVAWTVPGGLTQVAVSNTTLTATIFLSGGTAGSSYDVVCRVTTAATQSRVDDRTIRIKCKET
jgi:hypothetical protein